METVKARKQGNSIMVTLSNRLSVKEGQEFFYCKDSEGIISLIPKVDDYFQDVKAAAFIDEEDKAVKNFSPRGNE